MCDQQLQILFSCNKEGVNYEFSDITNDLQTQQWLLQNFLNWEPFTFKIFNQVKNKDKNALDIGAWIGLTGIWLCHNFKKVICVEADVLSAQSLDNNLKSSLCYNYEIIQKALYNQNTNLIFGANLHLPNAKLNQSTSQIKDKSSNNTDYMVNTITLNEIFIANPINMIGFIKIDIEGGEEYILSELFTICKINNIPLLISFHICWWKTNTLEKFSELFKNVKFLTEENEDRNDLYNYLGSHPMATVFINFTEIKDN